MRYAVITVIVVFALVSGCTSTRTPTAVQVRTEALADSLRALPPDSLTASDLTWLETYEQHQPTQGASTKRQETNTKRWTVRYSGALEPSGQGFADYLSEQGFDDTRQGFLGPIDYPLTDAEVGTGWSITYAYRPWLRVGGLFYRAPNMNTRGYNSESGSLTLKREMWAVSPVAVWTPTGYAAVGAGPALLRGSVTFEGSQKEPFVRLGAVAFASLGFTLFRTVHVGVLWQYLYGGETEIGPYDYGEGVLEAESVRLDQFTVGPIVEIRF